MRRPYDMYILPCILVILFVQGLVGILQELFIFKLSDVFSSFYLLFNYTIILALLFLMISSAILIFLGRNLGRLLYLILVILVFSGSMLLNIDKVTLIAGGIIFLISIWSLFRPECDQFFM
ncbi:hypothetical protein [Pasteurella sp. PK-2025]|uniref:hypothetical protein n=1 Tax=unclassified Pasteurella TaxID=2621516 RepID=UPI003C75D522